MNREDYPEVLRVEHIQEILGVGKVRAYEIMEIDSFPLIRLGRKKMTPRDKFFEWLENESMKGVK